MADKDGYAGNIASKIGANIYSVNVVNASPPVAVPVIILNLDASEELEVGYGLIFVQIGTSYYSTVPSWVE